MLADIVNLDPYKELDTEKVAGEIKIMEEEEKYVIERDKPTDISSEVFASYMPERYKRIQLEKHKETNNKRLNQLKDHLHYLRSDLNTLQDEFNVLDQKCNKIEDRAAKLRFNFEVIVYLKQG